MVHRASIMSPNQTSADRTIASGSSPGAGSRGRSRGRGRGRTGRGGGGGGGGGGTVRGGRGGVAPLRAPRVPRNPRAPRPPRLRGDALGGTSGAGSLRSARPAVKLCVRRLPPTMTAADFFSVADPERRASWATLFQGSAKLSDPQSASRPSIAYVAFTTLDEADAFYDRVQDQVFLDAASGIRYVAFVERALNQAVPRPNRKSCAALAGTIETDPDFLKFSAAYDDERRVEQALNAPPSLSETDALFRDPASTIDDDIATTACSPGDGNKTGAAVNLLDGTGANALGVVVTPLLEEVRARRRERDGAKIVVRKAGRRARRLTTSVTSGSLPATIAPATGSTSGLKSSNPGGPSSSKPVPEPGVAPYRESRGPKAKITVLHSVTCPPGSRPSKITSSSSVGSGSRKSESTATQSKGPPRTQTNESYPATASVGRPTSSNLPQQPNRAPGRRAPARIASGRGGSRRAGKAPSKGDSASGSGLNANGTGPSANSTGPNAKVTRPNANAPGPSGNTVQHFSSGGPLVAETGNSTPPVGTGCPQGAAAKLSRPSQKVRLLRKPDGNPREG